jgi:hypothetical protein
MPAMREQLSNRMREQLADKEAALSSSAPLIGGQQRPTRRRPEPGNP